LDWGNDGIVSSFPQPVLAVRITCIVDHILRAVRASEFVEASGSILFRNVKIEPAEKGHSLNSRPTWP
jgi:GDP-D-mannose dehydratase